jgi:hypothetical protein
VVPAAASMPAAKPMQDSKLAMIAALLLGSPDFQNR